MSDWITLTTFPYPQSAHIAAAMLESEGIPVFLKDEMTIQVDVLLSPALGGVKLQVQEEYFEEAYELLKKGGYITES